MARKSCCKKLHQTVHPWIAALALTSASIITVGVLLLVAQPTNRPAVAVPQQYHPVATATPSPFPHTTYSSSKLGISFSYIPFFPNGIGQYFFTKEIGDTIYLYWVPGANQPFAGTNSEFLHTIAPRSYSVEVFRKDPQQSLVSAIKQQFLTGYAETDCFVKPTRYGHPREDESYQTAEITIPFPNNTIDEWNARMAKCPRGYTNGSRGISYFMMDPKHSDKLLFIKLGQDNIPSGIWGKGTWDNTIKVLQ